MAVPGAMWGQEEEQEEEKEEDREEKEEQEQEGAPCAGSPYSPAEPGWTPAGVP